MCQSSDVILRNKVALLCSDQNASWTTALLLLNRDCWFANERTERLRTWRHMDPVKVRAWIISIDSLLSVSSSRVVGWVTPPMFQVPPLQPPPTTGQAPPPQSSPRAAAGGTCINRLQSLQKFEVKHGLKQIDFPVSAFMGFYAFVTTCLYWKKLQMGYDLLDNSQ